jgi:curved DNA-binding protein CbpA
MKVDEAAAILGVSPDADLEVLKQTFRKLALVWHPDKVN